MFNVNYTPFIKFDQLNDIAYNNCLFNIKKFNN